MNKVALISLYFGKFPVNFGLWLKSAARNADIDFLLYGDCAKTVLDFNSLDVKEAYDRIYTVKVSVYKAGAAGRNFPEEDKILTLDGSKEN